MKRAGGGLHDRQIHGCPTIPAKEREPASTGDPLRAVFPRTPLLTSRRSHLIAHFSPDRWFRSAATPSTIWSTTAWLPSSASHSVDRMAPSSQLMTARDSCMTRSPSRKGGAAQSRKTAPPRSSEALNHLFASCSRHDHPTTVFRHGRSRTISSGLYPMRVHEGGWKPMSPARGKS